MVMRIVKLLLVTLASIGVYCCSTGKAGRRRPRVHLPPPRRDPMLQDYGASNEENFNPFVMKNIKNSYDRNKIRGWRGWKQSRDTIKKWDAWLDDYYAETANLTNIDYVDPNNLHEFDKERGPGSNFPSDWADMGAGKHGVPPPPWAYEPVLTNVAWGCHLRLDRGRICRKNEKSSTGGPGMRFAYNPVTFICVSFIYLGCEGNQNKFQTQEKCVATCIEAATSLGGCDSDSQIPIDKS